MNLQVEGEVQGNGMRDTYSAVEKQGHLSGIFRPHGPSVSSNQTSAGCGAGGGRPALVRSCCSVLCCSQSDGSFVLNVVRNEP